MSKRIQEIKDELVRQVANGRGFTRFGLLGYRWDLARETVEQIFELLGIEELEAQARAIEGAPVAEFVVPHIKERVGFEFAKVAPISVLTHPQTSNDRMNRVQRITASAIIITKEP